MAAEIRADLGERRKAALLAAAQNLEISAQELLRRAVDAYLIAVGTPPERRQIAVEAPVDRRQIAVEGDYRGRDSSSSQEASSVVEVSSESPGKREHQGVEPPEQSSLPGISLGLPPAAQDPPTGTRGRDRPPRALAPPDPDFERFYRAYPRKKARAKALAAWAKLRRGGRLPAVELVLAAVEAMRAEMLAEGRSLEFCPYPASWLNAEQWADDHRTAEEILAAAEPPDPEALRQAERDRRREEETERVFQEFQRRSGLRLVEGGQA